MDDEDRYTRITLRIPKDLHASLSAEAAATSKSLNAQIVETLQASTSLRASLDSMGAQLQATQHQLETAMEIESVRTRLAEITTQGLVRLLELTGPAEHNDPDVALAKKLISGIRRGGSGVARLLADKAQPGDPLKKIFAGYAAHEEQARRGPKP